MKLVLFLVLITCSLLVHAKTVCLGGVSAEDPLQTSGMNDLIDVVNKANTNVSFDQEIVDSTCEAICLNDLENYKVGVSVLMEPFSGTEDEKYKRFHREYFSNVKCSPKTISKASGMCKHHNYNFLRTSVIDFQDTFIDELINNQNVDLNSPDPSDGLTVVEWIKKKCDGDHPTKQVKDYYCGKSVYIACKAFKQNPKGSKPVGCEG